MSHSLYKLHHIVMEKIDADDDGEEWAPIDGYNVWVREFRSDERAVRRAIRSIKRRTYLGDMDVYELFRLGKDGPWTRVPLPYVYVSSWSPGPRWLTTRITVDRSACS